MRSDARSGIMQLEPGSQGVSIGADIVMRNTPLLSRSACALGLLWVCAAFPDDGLAAEDGRVFVRSRPSGARVFLDDETEPRGKTPCIVRNVPPGTHVMRASLDGYADVTQEIEVDAGALSRASLVFATTASAKEPGEVAEGEPAKAPAETEREREPAEEAADTTEETTTETGDEAPESDEPPKYVHVDCLVCRGTGLLQEMGCATCVGTGWEGVYRCPDCRGKRRVEFDCPYCKGAGALVRGGKQIECSKCKGKGKLPCPLCRGKGKLKRKNPEYSGKSAMPCPYCQGSGFGGNVKCIRCAGRGNWTPMSGGMYIVGRVNCEFCGGDGEGPPLCRRCRGAGVLSPKRNPVICGPCFGTGRQFPPCRACAGNGWIRPR